MPAMRQAKPLIILTIATLLSVAQAHAATHSAKRKPHATGISTAAVEATVGPDELGDADFDPASPPRQLRVLVALGASTFFFQNGRPHGVEYTMLQDLEKYLNRDRPRNGRPVKFTYLPVDAGDLVPQLRAGKGDIAAGLIPASAGLGQLVSQSAPYLEDQWCVVQQRGAPAIEDLSDLGGRSVLQPPASYARRLLAEGPKVPLQEAPTGSTAESVLGEVQKEPANITLASRYVTRLWSKRYDKLQLGTCLPQTVENVWITQQNKPQLLAEINHFIASRNSNFADKALAGTQRFITPDSDGRVVSPDQLTPTDKLGFFAPMFQLVATANNMDWLLLAAIGQKETSLNPVIRKNGPTGLMQINPLTARKMGVSNPHDNQQNVTAAAKYLSYLRDMFNSPSIRPDDQMAFMIAAYNAGEGRIQQLRKKAAAQGLDPDKWNGNVENVAKQSGTGGLREYVASVTRFYSSYKSASKVASASAPEVAENNITAATQSGVAVPTATGDVAPKAKSGWFAR